MSRYGVGSFYYGFDASTGGYFWQMLDENGDVFDEKEGITLNQLVADTPVALSLNTLVKDFYLAETPTPMSDKIKESLWDVERDLIVNFKEKIPQLKNYSLSEPE